MTAGAAGLFSGPFGLLRVAVLLMMVPGSVPATTVTSNTTVTELLAGTVMPDTLTMPLSLAPAGGGVNELVAPAGMETKPPKVDVVGHVVGQRNVDAPARPRSRVSVMV